jgi:hypothetical protein
VVCLRTSASEYRQLLLSGALLASRIERVVENTEAKMQQYMKVGGAQFWAKVEGELERAADPAYELPPEMKRKLLSQFTSWWSGGVHSWPKSRLYSRTLRDRLPPPVRRAASNGNFLFGRSRLNGNPAHPPGVPTKDGDTEAWVM